MLSRSAKDRDQWLRDRQPSPDLPEVECDVRAHQVRSIRRDQAVLEGPDPGGLRHPPERALGEHLVRIRRPATAREAAIDIGGEPLEVRVDLVTRFTVRVRERVLLVRRERELAACGTSEREPGPGHRSGTAALDREVDQLRGERLHLQRQDATDIRRRQRSRVQREKEAGQPRRHQHELVLVGRAQDPVTEREGAVRLAEHDVRRREHAHRPERRIHDRQVLDAGIEHVDRGLDGELRRGHGDGGHRETGDGVVRRHATQDHAASERRIGEDLELRRVRDEDRRALVVGHRLCGRADRVVVPAEDRRPRDQVGDAYGRDLGQGVHDVPRPCQTLAQARGDVARACGPAEHRQGLATLDQVADDVGLVASHGERRSHSRQQRRMPEALSGLEHVHQLALVLQLDRPPCDDVQVPGRLAVLDEDVLAEAVVAHGRACSEGAEVARRERVEGRECRQEPRDLSAFAGVRPRRGGAYPRLPG